MFLLLLISLPLLVTLSRTISKPIKTLKDTVEMFGKGQLAVRSNISRADEIGHLQVSFNKMADDINNLWARITEENKQRRILELDMLEYQINPHFLYNSLDSINWMARKAGNEDIGEMAMALSRFFRVGLSKGKEYYTVADELEHVRQYLLINKIRYKDCFTYDIQADPEVLSYTTIKIMLQPIVENAIKYGVDKSGTGGCIVVSVKKDGEKLCFTVADNGCGIPRDKLTDIQKALADKVLPDDDSENGFGLYHVNQRIWLHYGNGYGITLHCAQMEGLIVRVCIPLIRIPEINP
jgi:two-component system sensor histidine kinase YesM